MTKQEKEAGKWARNLARNYRTGIDYDTYSGLLDACNELGLNKNKMDWRWQWAGDSDLRRTAGIYFILTGKPYWRKGYIWF